MTRLWRAPLVHFFALGALLFALRAAVSSHWPHRAHAPIVVGSDDDSMLVREALARGLDREPAMEKRIANVRAFLDEKSAATWFDPTTMDAVVRRHLSDTMRLQLGALGPDERITPADVRRYVHAHEGAFHTPSRLRFVQIFLRREHESRIASIAHLLSSDEKKAAALGDPFIRGNPLELSTDEIDRQFGRAVVDELRAMPVGTWSRAIRSPLGTHWFLVEDRVMGGLPPLDQIYTRAAESLAQERSAAHLGARLATLRAR